MTDHPDSASHRARWRLGTWDTRLVVTAIVTAVAFLAAFSLRSPSPVFASGALVLAILAWHRRGLLLAYSLNGFFLYLAALDVAGSEPRTAVTGAYYGFVGVLLVGAAARHRLNIQQIVTGTGRLVHVWLVAAGLLAIWFCVNAAIFREGGSVAQRFVGLLLLATIPAVLAALSLDRRSLDDLRLGLVALGLIFCGATGLALAAGSRVETRRFSPIDELDPISAALIPSLAVVALLSLRCTRRRWMIAQAGAAVVLMAGAAVMGARGPVLSAAVAVTALIFLRGRRQALTLFATMTLGVALASVAVVLVGSGDYYRQAVRDVSRELNDPRSASETTGAPTVPDSEAQVSSLESRRVWIRDALAAFPSKPLFGHGIVTLPDRSETAKQLGTVDALRYPHNDLVESAYSLGAIGLVLFLVLIGTPVVALLKNSGACSRSGQCSFAVGVFVFAFVQSNFSGEIGADSLLWVSALLCVVLLPAARADAAPPPDRR